MQIINALRYDPWWVCGICGRKRHLSGLAWQNLNVSLRCEHCYDRPDAVQYSQRAARIAAVLQRVPRYGEPELDPKLANPPLAVGPNGF